MVHQKDVLGGVKRMVCVDRESSECIGRKSQEDLSLLHQEDVLVDIVIRVTVYTTLS